ncbi:MAG: hypothetical protein EOM40_07120 [Clostridia bacterium]|nr:hypothetical protein [Clostridia bacterium]NCC44607.1 hypothetical protein [Clostridia bacterium]
MAKSMEEIALLLQNTRFKRRVFGGISPADMWQKLERLQKEYAEVIEEQQLANQILQKEKDRQIAELEKKLLIYMQSSGQKDMGGAGG